TSSRCSCPASRKVVASSTDTLIGTSASAAGLKVPVMMTSSSGDSDSGDIERTGYATDSNETQTRDRKLPAPYAGTNRIRFNGFAGITGISGPAGPPQGLWLRC